MLLLSTVGFPDDRSMCRRVGQAVGGNRATIDVVLSELAIRPDLHRPGAELTTPRVDEVADVERHSRLGQFAEPPPHDHLRRLAMDGHVEGSGEWVTVEWGAADRDRQMATTVVGMSATARILASWARCSSDTVGSSSSRTGPSQVKSAGSGREIDPRIGELDRLAVLFPAQRHADPRIDHDGDGRARIREHEFVSLAATHFHRPRTVRLADVDLGQPVLGRHQRCGCSSSLTPGPPTIETIARGFFRKWVAGPPSSGNVQESVGVSIPDRRTDGVLSPPTVRMLEVHPSGTRAAVHRPARFAAEWCCRSVRGSAAHVGVMY